MKDINRSRHAAAARSLDSILTDDRLTDTEKVLLIKLMAVDTERFKVTRQGLATMLHHNVKTIDKALSHLKELQLLRTISRRDEAGRWETCYIITDYMEQAEQQADATAAAPSSAEPVPTEPLPNIWVHNIYTTTAIHTEADPIPTTTTDGQPSAPTFEEVKGFAEQIHAKADPRRYWLLRSASGWRTKTGRAVTAWQLDFELWNMNERPAALSATAAAPSSAATKPARVYSGFEQREPALMDQLFSAIALPL